MGLLDSAGLAYFWGKVKSALAGKQNTITTGDGLSKEGDTLSVSNPNRGILTQAEYDALTPEQKASGTYFVDDGGGGGGSGSSGEVYSTEERRIGTWIDGKPLYRKVFKGKTASETNAITEIDVSDLNVSEVTNIRGILISTNSYFYPLDYYSTDSNRLSVFFEGSIMVIYKGSSYRSRAFTVVLEYTKTTDESTVSTDEGGTA